MSEFIKNNSTIFHLVLFNNSIGKNTENLKYLSEGLKVNSSILYLNLLYNNIDNSEKTKYLSEEVLKKKMEIFT